MDFINCGWPKGFYGRNILYDEAVLFHNTGSRWNRFKSLFKGPDKKRLKKVEDLYRKLKQKYKEEHDEQEVSNWHYGEKETYRKANWRRRFFPFLSLTNLYWLSSGYAERPVRAGIFLACLIFGLSLLQAATGLDSFSGANAHGIDRIYGIYDLTNCSKLKAVFVNTLQYASFEKIPLFKPATLYGEFVKIATRIFVPLQAALFALAVRNRLRR